MFGFSGAKEPGKFDLVYQSADGEELIEYAVPQDTKVRGACSESSAELAPALLPASGHLRDIPFVVMHPI